MRSLPGQVNRRDVISGKNRVGASSRKPSGSGCSAPWCTTNVRRCSSRVRTSRGVKPMRSHSCSAHGFSEMNESGPASMTKPSMRSVAIAPPRCRPASSRVTCTGRCCSRLSSTSRCAAARPAMPPPTTAMCGVRLDAIASCRALVGRASVPARISSQRLAGTEARATGLLCSQHHARFGSADARCRTTSASMRMNAG